MGYTLELHADIDLLHQGIKCVVSCCRGAIAQMT